MSKNSSPNLPRNRFQEFKYVASLWDRMLTLSLLVTLFALPLIAILSVSAVAEASLLKDVTDGAEYLSKMLQMRVFAGLLSVVGFYPFMLGLSGAFYFIRRTVWSQGATIKSDFFKGVKGGLAASIAPAAFATLTYLFFEASLIFVPVFLKNIAWQIVMYVVVALVVILMFSVIMYDLAQNAIYKVSFFHRLKNSFIFALVKYPRNALAAIITFLPFVPMIMWRILGMTVAFTVMAVYCFALCVLGQTLFCHSVFDKYINEKEYPDLVKKGLAKEEKQ
ncbi:MAG: hypothetical protein NC132_03990 [Corallococcus sp.]|nr:hypothetical protein [Corallococcus sp.]MCM1359819.1 hypothetical protein [Corallococcus sp.]MCM1395253.1 hypothetical protein [Corallococcus sp.]